MHHFLKFLTLANIALGLGAITACLSIVEWFLTDSQKGAAEGKLYRAWIWLADHKTIRSSKWLSNQDISNVHWILVNL
jgi:hypothetical protein